MIERREFAEMMEANVNWKLIFTIRKENTSIFGADCSTEYTSEVHGLLMRVPLEVTWVVPSEVYGLLMRTPLAVKW